MMRHINSIVTIVTAGFVGASSGYCTASAASSFFFRRTTDPADVRARPLSAWDHVPAIEHVPAVPMALACTNVVYRALARTHHSAAHFYAAVAVCALEYVSYAKVVDRIVRRPSDGAVQMTYLPMDDFLIGHWDGSWQRTRTNAPAVRIE